MSIRQTDQSGFHHIMLLLAVVVVGTIGTVGWYVNQKNSNDKTSSSTKASISKEPAKTLDKTGAFKLETVTAGGCSALLPVGWDKPTTNDASTSFDAFGPDKSMYAGYGHQTINTKLAGFADNYDAPMNDPDLYSSDTAAVALAYSKIIATSLGGNAALSYTNKTNDKIGDYQLRSVASSGHQGVVFFHRDGFAGDGQTYTYSLPMYFALASTSAWKSSGLSLARVSASINCNAQLVARSSGPDIGGGSSSEDTKDENGDEDGYNPQLGTEYVHDRSTGENYVVDPSRDWSETGPNGGGYYVPKGGGDYTQLEPGRSD